MEPIKASEMTETGQMHPKFMVIGTSGGGKTTALTTFPKDWRVLVLDMFGNKESLEGCENVEILSYSDPDPKDPTAFQELIRDWLEIISMLSEDKFPYQVLALDTMTGLLRFIEMHILRMNPDNKGIGGAASQPHYRGLAHMSAEFIQGLIAFPTCIVINAHSELIRNEQTGSLQYQAIISGARMRNTIYSYVGEVYRAFGEPGEELDKEGNPTTEFFWQTQPDREWTMLKSVLNKKQKVFGKYLEPNYEALLKRRGLVK